MEEVNNSLDEEIHRLLRDSLEETDESPDPYHSPMKILALIGQPKLFISYILSSIF